MFCLESVQAPRPGELRIRMQISSDGLAAFPGAVDLAFAKTVDIGVIIKSSNNNEEAPGRYGSPKLEGIIRQVITGDFDLMSICTRGHR